MSADDPHVNQETDMGQETKALTDTERMEIGATFDATRMFLEMHGHESDHDWLVTHMRELLDLGDRLIEAHDAGVPPVPAPLSPARTTETDKRLEYLDTRCRQFDTTDTVEAIDFAPALRHGELLTLLHAEAALSTLRGQIEAVRKFADELDIAANVIDADPEALNKSPRILTLRATASKLRLLFATFPAEKGRDHE